MRAVVVDRYGGPEVLELGERPVPKPARGEVLVHVQVAGVNFGDTERRRGVYDPPPLPYVPGNEAAGIVEVVGDDVDPAWLGRRVAFWAMRTSGTYAEYVAVPAASLFDLRDDLDFERAVALPSQGLTAYALAHVATQLAPGQTALVHAAAGGVGTLLIQLLKRRGVRVLGTASSASKRALVEKLGAVALGYGATFGDEWHAATDGRGVDAVFDSVGRASREQSFAALAPHGHLVYFGESSGPPPPIDVEELYARSLKVSAFWLNTDPPSRWEQARRDLQAWVVSGELQVCLAGSFELADAARAHEQIEARDNVGKTVLRV